MQTVRFGLRMLQLLHDLQGDEDDENARPLAESLLLAIADLLFCPEFSVQSHRKNNLVSSNQQFEQQISSLIL